jgi:hypothetical protein
MKKLIDIPDEVRWKLEVLAKKRRFADLTAFIRHLLTKVAEGK